MSCKKTSFRIRRLELLVALLIVALSFGSCAFGDAEHSTEQSNEACITSDVSEITINEAELSSNESDRLPEVTEPVETNSTVSTVKTEPPVTTTVSEPTIVPDFSSEQTIAPAPEFDVSYFENPVVMYPMISLNVRSGPSTDFERIGSLREGHATNVVGAASTGWYLIEFNGGHGYVSNNYMTRDDPNAESEPVGYPQLEPIDSEIKAEMIADYSRHNFVTPGSIYLAGYYGLYSNRPAVIICTDRQLSDTAYEITVAGYTFAIPSESVELTIFEAGFIPISDAYSIGYLNDDDIAKLHHYYNEIGVDLTPPKWEYPRLEPLSDSIVQELVDDWLDTLSEPNRKLAVEFGVYVRKYYGTYGGNEVVLMSSPNPVTDFPEKITVAGYDIWFSDSDTDISVHYNGKFVPLVEAYETGLLSEEDLAAISYYSMR